MLYKIYNNASDLRMAGGESQGQAKEDAKGARGQVDEARGEHDRGAFKPMSVTLVFEGAVGVVAPKPLPLSALTKHKAGS